MLQTINTNTLREQLLYDVNHSNPETLQLFYNFMQVLKKSFPKEKQLKEKHHLDDSFGVLSNEEGQEMIDCINREFNNIEGEW